MIDRATIALVVLSGGQDSTTCLAWAKQNYDEVHAITIDYGQRHRREIQAALDVGKILGVATHQMVVVGSILQSTSPLVSDQPLETYSDYKSMDEIIGDRVEKTFVPMRNQLFLTIAANRAVKLGARVIVTGVCQADNANYPDCRLSFINSLETTINESLGLPITDSNYLHIATPLMLKAKHETVDMMRGNGLFATLAFTHTAYDGNYPPVSKDHANTLRAQGFLEAGMPDPLVLRAVGEGLMELPATHNYGNAPQIASLIEDINWLKREHGLVDSVGASA